MWTKKLKDRCYNCGDVGHKSPNCPSPKLTRNGKENKENLLLLTYSVYELLIMTISINESTAKSWEDGKMGVFCNFSYRICRGNN